MAKNKKLILSHKLLALCVLQGYNKVALGDFAANVRRQREPEPYKGKGIRFAGEIIKLKEGKAGARSLRKGGKYVRGGHKGGQTLTQHERRVGLCHHLCSDCQHQPITCN